MNVVRTYAFARAYLLALILWAVLWIIAVVAMSPPGAASLGGIFRLLVTCIGLGAGFSIAFYVALRVFRVLGWPSPLAIIFSWALTPVVTLTILRFGEWDEAIAAGLAGVIAGGAFWALSRGTEFDATEHRGPIPDKEV